MSSKEQTIAAEYKQFTEVDILQAKMMILCRVLKLYADAGYSNLAEAYEAKISSVASRMLEDFPEETYLFGLELLTTDFQKKRTDVVSDNEEKNLAMGIVALPNFQKRLVKDLQDEEQAITIFDSLSQIITLDIDSKSVKEIFYDAEVHSKMLAMILVLELKEQYSSRAFRELYATVLIELANPRVINAINSYKGYPQSHYIYEALKSKIE